ncbi:MAG: copper resistance protein CopC [Chloroflexota bacterium]
MWYLTRSRSALVAARATVGLVVAVLLFAGSVHPASAHALYEKSQPTTGGQLDTPGQIQVWFTEDVEPSFSKIQVLDTSRRPVDLGDSNAALGTGKALVVSVPKLPDGTYMVAWRALSAVDGHVTQGVFPLVVGAGGLDLSVTETPAFVPGVPDVLARWLGYLAALLLTGGFIFRRLIAAPALAQEPMDGLGQELDRRLRQYGLMACGVLAVATLVGLTVQAANAADLPVVQAIGEPVVRLLSTRLGMLWEARLACAFLLALLLWQMPVRYLDWVGLPLSLTLLMAISLSSHAAAIPSGTWLAVLLDWLHQIAASAWVGGLFPFVLLLALARKHPDGARATPLAAALVPRFSTLAIVCVAVLAASGLFQSWLQVKAPQALATLYGYSLIVKLLLVAPMLALGAANLLVARPGLARAVATRGRGFIGSAPTVVRRLHLAVIAEVALAVGVLLATAVLTSSEPARETYARQPKPVELQGTAEDVGVRLNIAPGRPGPNQIVATLDGHINPPNDVQRVSLRFTNLDDDLGASNLVLNRRDDGTYGAVASNITVDGTWQMEVIVRRRGLDDARTAFRTPIHSPDIASQPPSLDAIPTPTSIPPRQLISMVLMATGLALTFWISRTRDVRRRERATLYAASFAVAMIGGVLYARASIAPSLPADARALKNPFPPDTASIARGKEVYEQQCVTCHGPNGRGDGPLAASLRPRPADFRVHMAAGHTDGELYTWLSKGVPGTAMPAFEGQISDNDRWHVVNYIRGFAPSAE